MYIRPNCIPHKICMFVETNSKTPVNFPKDFATTKNCELMKKLGELEWRNTERDRSIHLKFSTTSFCLHVQPGSRLLFLVCLSDSTPGSCALVGLTSSLNLVVKRKANGCQDEWAWMADAKDAQSTRYISSRSVRRKVSNYIFSMFRSEELIRPFFFLSIVAIALTVRGCCCCCYFCKIIISPLILW